MKRFFALLLALALVLSLRACGASPAGETAPAGPTPEAAAAPTPEPSSQPAVCTALELNQALSYGVDDGGALYPMDTFVAGKTTAVIARFDTPAADPAAYTLEAAGQTLTGALTPDGGVAFTVPAALLEEPGDYTFRLTGGAQAEISAFFAQTRTLRLLLVPVRGNYGGTVTEPQDGWQQYDSHLRACYPIAESHVTTDLGELLDLSDAKYDLYQASVTSLAR